MRENRDHWNKNTEESDKSYGVISSEHNDKNRQTFFLFYQSRRQVLY